MDKQVNLRVGDSVARLCRERGIKIRKADHTGDSCVAVIDPSSETSVQVGWDELNKFMDECISQFGSAPPIWAGKSVEGKNDLQWSPLDRKSDDITTVEEVLVHYPLIGG